MEENRASILARSIALGDRNARAQTRKIRYDNLAKSVVEIQLAFRAQMLAHFANPRARYAIPLKQTSLSKRQQQQQYDNYNVNKPAKRATFDRGEKRHHLECARNSS